MAQNYKPKKNYISQTRLEKLIKDLIEDCKEDRRIALSVVKDFQNALEATNIVDLSINIIDALKLAQESNEKIVKLIEIASKITIKEIDAETKVKTKPTSSEASLSFEDLSKNTNG